MCVLASQAIGTQYTVCMIRRPWFLIALGFLAACVLDVACPRHSEAMTMQPTGGDWIVSFDAHPDNEVLFITVECRKGNDLWRAALVHDLDFSVSQIRLRIPTTPQDYHCVAIGMVMRNPRHDHDSDHQVIGESTLIIMGQL